MELPPGGGRASAFVCLPSSTPCSGCFWLSLTSHSRLSALCPAHGVLWWEFLKGTTFSGPFLSICWWLS